MNKFGIVSCVKVDENDYSGPCVILSCKSDPSFMLFFPIAKDSADIISYVLKGGRDYDVDTNVLGIYKTMISSWRSSDRYLSGIIMDSVYDEELDDDILMIRLALSDHKGHLDSLVKVNFLHAILIAAMEKVDLIISDQLISQMLPPPPNNKQTDGVTSMEELFTIMSGDDEEDEEGMDLFDEDNGEKYMPPKGNKPNKRKSKQVYVEDKKIVDIARKIMSGKIKEKDKKSKEEDQDGDINGDKNE